jgi:sugar phosphate permease
MKLELKSLSENRFIRVAGEIAQQIFVVLLVTYLLLLLAETVWEESASSVINLNYLLIAVIAVGIPAVLAGGGKPAGEVKEPLGLKDILLIACAAVAGAVIVWFKTKDIGWPSVIMSIISCALIAMLSLLILKGEDERKTSRHK